VVSAQASLRLLKPAPRSAIAAITLSRSRVDLAIRSSRVTTSTSPGSSRPIGEHNRPEPDLPCPGALRSRPQTPYRDVAIWVGCSAALEPVGTHAAQSFEAPRFHHPSRWRGCRMAARGARAAAGNASDRVHQRRVGCCRRALCGRESRAKRSNTEPQPSHRRLYQHYRPDSDISGVGRQRAGCTIAFFGTPIAVSLTYCPLSASQ
jgi:hypothetical protein